MLIFLGILAVIIGLSKLSVSLLGNNLHDDSGGTKRAAKGSTYSFVILVFAAIILAVAAH